MGLEPASVRPCVRPNISETSRPITIKFYLKHHWGGGKAALGFGADQIRTLVSIFDRILFILAGNEDIHKSLDEFEFRPDPTTDYGVSCP